MSDLSALLAFAHRLADAAASETVPLFRATQEITTSWVTTDLTP